MTVVPKCVVSGFLSNLRTASGGLQAVCDSLLTMMMGFSSSYSHGDISVRTPAVGPRRHVVDDYPPWPNHSPPEMNNEYPSTCLNHSTVPEYQMLNHNKLHMCDLFDGTRRSQPMIYGKIGVGFTKHYPTAKHRATTNQHANTWLSCCWQVVKSSGTNSTNVVPFLGWLRHGGTVPLHNDVVDVSHREKRGEEKCN